MSLAADILQLLSAAAAIVLSYMHHHRSIRPSTLLSLYLPAMSLVGIARSRTLWLVPGARSESITFVFVLAFTIMSFAIESSGKERLLTKSANKPRIPEAYSGFWKLVGYLWLRRTFLDGYSKVISVQDLPELDPGLASDVVHQELADTWAKCKLNTGIH